MAEKKAQLWINHDKPQSQAQKRSPQFYDYVERGPPGPLKVVVLSDSEGPHRRLPPA